MHLQTAPPDLSRVSPQRSPFLSRWFSVVLVAVVASSVYAGGFAAPPGDVPIRPTNVPDDVWDRITEQLEQNVVKSYPATAEAVKIFPSVPEASARFGWSTAADGDTIVVGAFGNGTAYLFERNQGGADTWGEVKKLVGSDADSSSHFGRSVGISGDTVVVGANGVTGGGAAYIFQRNQGGVDNWGQVAKITGADQGSSDSFGFSASISNDLVIVGAKYHNTSKGAAYIFERNQGGADSWGQVAKVIGSTTETLNFGNSVAISGDTVVVGAQNGNSAFVFERNQGGADNWGEVAELTASNAGSNDWYAYSVAIGGDTVVVGSPYADGTGNNHGSAYVYERNHGGADSWGEVAILTASDPVEMNLLGSWVAIDGDTVVSSTSGSGSGSVYLFDRNQGGADSWGQAAKLSASDGADLANGVAVSGATLVFGAGGDATYGFTAGAAYIFRRSGETWIQAAKTDADDTAGNDIFGFSLAMDDDVAVVGAWQDDMSKGAAYVFERNQGGADSWGQVARLTASDGYMYERFGESVDISGDHVVVGAPAHGSGPSYYMAGAAYVFSRNHGGADSWGEVAKLMAPDATTYDQFGWSVGIDHDLVVVGANKGDGAVAGSGTVPGSGAAYLFARNQGGADAWGSVTELNAVDGAAYDYFGESVDVSGNWVAVGAVGDENSTGAVYLYTRNRNGADSWGQVQKLTASDAETSEQFGFSVALNRGAILVGAPYGDAAYLFERNQGGADNWGEVQVLTASDGHEFDRFGWSVSLTAGLAAVGATKGDGAVTDSGAAYLYQRNTGGADNWGELIKLEASDGALDDSFGQAVALSGHRLWCGAPADDDEGMSSGSAYRFEIRAAILEADLSITLDDSTSTAVPGESTTYEIEVGNDGPGDVSGANVSDDFPASLSCNWSCVATGAGSCTSGPVAGNIDDSVDLPMGETLTYTAECSISPDATGVLENTATVNPPGGYEDSDLDNNSETDQDTLAPAADLEIGVSNARSNVVRGESITYTIVVSNPGPSSVPGATVTDEFPADLIGVTWTCSGSGGGSCTASGSGNISESVDLPDGASVTFVATGTCDSEAAGPTLDNTATVSCPVGVSELDVEDNSSADSDAVVDAAVFSDGFETGDCTEWSSELP